MLRKYYIIGVGNDITIREKLEPACKIKLYTGAIMLKQSLMFTCLFCLTTTLFCQELQVKWIEVAWNVHSNATLHMQIDDNQLAWSYQNSVFVTDTLGEIIAINEWVLEGDRTTEDVLLLGEQGSDGWMILGRKEGQRMEGREEITFSDPFTLRLDAEGDTIWHRDYISDAYVRPRCIVQLDGGGYIFGGDIGDHFDDPSNMHFMGIDDNGRVGWQRRHDFMPADYHEMIWDIAPTADNGIVAVGRRARPGTNVLLGWMLRLDNHGDTLWTRIIGEYDEEINTAYEFRHIYRLDDGNFLVTGMYGDDRMQDDPRIWVLKIDEDSHIIWERGLTFPDTGETLYPCPEGFCEFETGELLISGHRDLFNYPFIYLLSPDGDSLQYFEWNPDSIRWYKGICPTWSNGVYLMMEGHPPNDHRYKTLIIKMELTENGAPVQSNYFPFTSRLYSAFPNPFNGSICLNYSLSTYGQVIIEIIRVDGRYIGTILNSYKLAGNYELRWDASGLPSGSYICRLSSSGGESSIILNLLK